MIDEPELALDEEKDNEFVRISKTISEVIINSTPQFTIGITGKWGTGKTTMMKSIKKTLEDW